jgi:hypothetical protein
MRPRACPRERTLTEDTSFDGANVTFRAVAVWGALLTLAVLNGGVRDIWLSPWPGDTVGRALSTALLCGLILLISWVTIGWIRPARRPRLTTAALLLLSLVSPAAAQERGREAGCPEMAELRRSLDSLEAHDPVDDARAAISRGDYRFWAVMGYGVVIPSVPEDRQLKLTPARYRVFEHTGDGHLILGCETTAGSLVDSTDVRWNQVTHAYAAIYNQVLVRLGY